MAVQSVIEFDSQGQQWAALIHRIAGGDQIALGTFYDSTSSLVFGLMLRMLTDRATAEEVLLDVYKQVWRQASLYDNSRGTPLGWLLVIARSRALDRLRSNKRERQLKEALFYQPGINPFPINPEQASVISEQQRFVRSALDALPAEQREVIELAYFSGLSQSEIAKMLDQPLGTVKTRTRLGMIKLRELLGHILEEKL